MQNAILFFCLKKETIPTCHEPLGGVEDRTPLHSSSLFETRSGLPFAVLSLFTCICVAQNSVGVKVVGSLGDEMHFLICGRAYCFADGLRW